MARTRRGTPPLFELLDDKHLRRAGTGPQPDLRLVRAEADQEDIASPPVQSRPRFNDPDAIIETPGKRPGVQLLGDRLHLSLTPMSAAAGIFVIAVVVLAAVFFGQKRGEKTVLERSAAGLGVAMDIEGIETVREQPPASHLVESLFVENAASAPGSSRKASPASAPPSAAPPVKAAREWTRDFTYIVAQEFGAGREADARKAQEFLASKGMAAGIVKLDNGALQLITFEGYNHKDPAQKKAADGILKKQRAAGAEYWASGGGYKLEGYYRTLKNDQW